MVAEKELCACLLPRWLLGFLTILLMTSAVSAIPVQEYRKQIQQAVNALDALQQSDETETAFDFETKRTSTVQAIRNIVPEFESVEWNGATVKIDNSWLRKDLASYEKLAAVESMELLSRITERLHAIEERLAEIEKSDSAGASNKSGQNRKLAEILERPEYARKIQQEGALARLLRQFTKWLENLLPKPKPLAPGSATLFSKIAQILVIGLAIAVLAYVMKLFAPRLLRDRRSKKKAKPQPRIVLGEKLEPDQTARDLLAEAEALAMQGDLRAAIRKAYIALLVELGDRKIISLAQHKTNRDYVGAVRRLEPLYENMKRLTDSFERHWYGFASASEADWRQFRTVYLQTLK